MGDGDDALELAEALAAGAAGEPDTSEPEAAPPSAPARSVGRPRKTPQTARPDGYVSQRPGPGVLRLRGVAFPAGETVTLTDLQKADKRLMAKIERAVECGVLARHGAD